MAKRPQRRSGQLTSPVIPEQPLEVVASPVSTYVNPGLAGAPAPPPGASPPVQPDLQEARDLAALGQAFGQLSKSLQSFGTAQVGAGIEMGKQAFEELVHLNMTASQALAEGLIDPSEHPMVVKARDRADSELPLREFALDLDQNIDMYRLTDPSFQTFDGGMGWLERGINSLLEGARGKPGGMSPAGERAFYASAHTIRQRFGGEHAKWVGKNNIRLATDGLMEHVSDQIFNADKLVREPGESSDDYAERQLKTALDSLAIEIDGDQARVDGYGAVFTKKVMNDLVAEALVEVMAEDRIRAPLAKRVWDSLQIGPVAPPEMIGTDPEAVKAWNAKRPFLNDKYGRLYQSRSRQIEANLAAADAPLFTPTEQFRMSSRSVEHMVQSEMSVNISTVLVSPTDNITAALDTELVQKGIDTLKSLLEQGDPRFLHLRIADQQGEDPYTITVVSDDPALMGQTNTFDIDMKALHGAAKREAYNKNREVREELWRKRNDDAAGRVAEAEAAGTVGSGLDYSLLDPRANPEPTQATMSAEAMDQTNYMDPVFQDVLIDGWKGISPNRDAVEIGRQRVYNARTPAEREAAQEALDGMMISGRDGFFKGYDHYFAALSLNPQMAAAAFEGENGNLARLSYETFHFLTTNLTNPMSKESAYQQMISVTRLASNSEELERLNDAFENQWNNIALVKPEYRRHRGWLENRTRMLYFVQRESSTPLTVEQALDSAKKMLTTHSVHIGGNLTLNENLGIKGLTPRVKEFQEWFGKRDPSSGRMSAALAANHADQSFYDSIPEDFDVKDIRWRMQPASMGRRWYSEARDPNFGWMIIGPGGGDGAWSIDQIKEVLHSYGRSQPQRWHDWEIGAKTTETSPPSLSRDIMRGMN